MKTIWSILAAQLHVNYNPNKISHYKKHIGNLKFDAQNGDFSDYSKFERENNIPINVFRIYDEKDKFVPIYRSELSPPNAINLGKYKYHYVWICNFNRFIGKQAEHTPHYCFYCNTTYSSHSKQTHMCDEMMSKKDLTVNELASAMGLEVNV